MRKIWQRRKKQDDIHNFRTISKPPFTPSPPHTSTPGESLMTKSMDGIIECLPSSNQGLPHCLSNVSAFTPPKQSLVNGIPGIIAIRLLSELNHLNTKVTTN
jgi:hypothetical protein